MLHLADWRGVQPTRAPLCWCCTPLCARRGSCWRAGGRAESCWPLLCRIGRTAAHGLTIGSKVGVHVAQYSCTRGRNCVHVARDVHRGVRARPELRAVSHRDVVEPQAKRGVACGATHDAVPAAREGRAVCRGGGAVFGGRWCGARLVSVGGPMVAKPISLASQRVPACPVWARSAPQCAW